MFAFFEKTLQRIRPIIRVIVKVSVLFVFISLGVFFIEVKVLPWLSTQPWAIRWGIAPQLNERVTIIERKESVTISQDESRERMGSEYGALIIGILEEEIVGSSDRPTASLLQRSQLLSGVFVTNDGLLVTYRHQAPEDNRYRYTLYLADNTSHEANVVGYDSLTNLLYLKIDGFSTTAIAFTNSNDVKLGRQLVLFSRTSAGLSLMINSIGALQRSFNLNPQTVASSEKWEGVIGLGMEWQASQLPGSPALFTNGELVGLFGTKKVDGVTSAFLIPASVVRESLSRVLEGKGDRPVFGMYYLTVTPEVQKVLGLAVDRGAMIYSPSERTGLSLLAGSSAARAGLQFGDIVTKVNGAEINLDLPLSVALGRLPTNGQVSLEILRAGVKQEVILAL
ncbi:MAG: PDZ domain-containing protein [Candidatus Moraniibacteriota bacterium]|nr:MAG: PDZ domain-containing protein [Candidatus Moranbacteria bacterium]